MTDIIKLYLGVKIIDFCIGLAVVIVFAAVYFLVHVLSNLTRSPKP